MFNVHNITHFVTDTANILTTKKMYDCHAWEQMKCGLL